MEHCTKSDVASYHILLYVSNKTELYRLTQVKIYQDPSVSSWTKVVTSWPAKNKVSVNFQIWLQFYQKWKMSPGVVTDRNHGMWALNPRRSESNFSKVSVPRGSSLTNPSQPSSAHEESANQSSLRLILSRHDCRQKLFNIVCCHESNSEGTADGCEHPVKEAMGSEDEPSLPSPLQLNTSLEWNRLITRQHCGCQQSGNQLGSCGCMTCHPFSNA